MGRARSAGGLWPGLVDACWRIESGPGSLEATRAGLAHLAADESYCSRLYCNYTENGSDSFSIQADNALIRAVG